MRHKFRQNLYWQKTQYCLLPKKKKKKEKEKNMFN